MTSTTKTLRLPDEWVKRLTEGDKMLNPSLVEYLDETDADRKAAMLDIKGIFSPSEWVALADSLNGTMITEQFRYNASAFVAHCEDSEMYDGTFSRHGADMKAVCEKIRNLTMTQVATVYRRVEAFWSHSNEIDIEKWSVY